MWLLQPQTIPSTSLECISTECNFTSIVIRTWLNGITCTRIGLSDPDGLLRAVEPFYNTESTCVPSTSSSTTSTVSNIWKSAAQSLSTKQRSALGFDGEAYKLQNEVLDLVASKQRICAAKQWAFKVNGKTLILRDVADKLLRWVDRFKFVGDLASQFDPVHAALPWAGFRFLLQV